MRGRLAAGALTVAALAPASASAATIGVAPSKSCYLGREGGCRRQRLHPGRRGGGHARPPLAGAGYGKRPRPDRGTAFARQVRGERNRLLAGTDQANPANYGVHRVRVTGVDVDVRPRRAGPGSRVRIRARGFTTSNRLYAHVRRGRGYRRDLLVGGLRRACHSLDRQVAIVPLGAGPGVYSVQFDGRRRYSSRALPRVRYRVTVFRRHTRRRVASAAGTSWARLRWWDH